jgi:hypothetical protein
MTAFARILCWIMVAAAAFHAAYACPNASFLVVLYLFALLQLAQADRWRKAFYSGLTVGLLIALVRLQFFCRLFSGGAVALWLVYAFWHGLPIFRVASSGISQLVDRAGQVTATAPCPGDGATLAGTIEMRGVGKLPLDRWLAPFATVVTAAVMVWLSIWRGAGNALPAGSKGQEV